MSEDICYWVEIEGGYTTKYQPSCGGRIEVYGGKEESAVCLCGRKVKFVPLERERTKSGQRS